MITYADIQDYIGLVLKKLNITTVTEKNIEKIKPPYFFISLRPIKTFNYIYNKNKLTNVDITYFSEHSTHEENLEMLEQLENAFGMYLKVKDRCINIIDTECKEVDTLLHFSFTLDYYVETEQKEENTEMKEIKVRMEE